jgi:hypothetical protein
VERSQHAGYVGQRDALVATLGERPAGLALEVDDHEVAPGPEHLAEVEVAMNTDARAVERRAQEVAQARQRVAATIDGPAHGRLQLAGQRIGVTLEQGQAVRDLVAHVLEQ